MVGLILRCLFLICRQVPPQESMGQLEFTHLDFIQVGSLALDCGLDGFISGCGLGSEKVMALNSSTLAWKIPWMEEPGRLQSRGREESDTTEQLHFHFSLSCIGERNGNPLQYSCLENPRDRGAWWAVVYGVAQSRTRLKRLSSSSSSGLGLFREKANSDSMLETVSLTCFLLWKC